LTIIFDPEAIKVIACETVIEEMLPFLPPNMTYEVLDFGLHLVPEGLKRSLQQSIDNTDPSIKTIILGYGLCAMAVVGLEARDRTLIIPRMDDCIGIFLGSREAYKQQAAREPGTYYLTKGWIEVNDTPLEEYRRMEERYGAERADRMMRLVLKNYTRIAYINTGLHDQEKYRAYAQEVARHFDLKYEEIPGSNGLVKQMLFGPWDEATFVIVPPGARVTYAAFKPATPPDKK
jgi:hypothetical protein